MSESEASWEQRLQDERDRAADLSEWRLNRVQEVYKERENQVFFQEISSWFQYNVTCTVFDYKVFFVAAIKELDELSTVRSYGRVVFYFLRVFFCLEFYLLSG